jgi:hypothetical protein
MFRCTIQNKQPNLDTTKTHSKDVQSVVAQEKIKIHTIENVCFKHRDLDGQFVNTS